MDVCRIQAHFGHLAFQTRSLWILEGSANTLELFRIQLEKSCFINEGLFFENTRVIRYSISTFLRDKGFLEFGVCDGPALHKNALTAWSKLVGLLDVGLTFRDPRQFRPVHARDLRLLFWTFGISSWFATSSVDNLWILDISLCSIYKSPRSCILRCGVWSILINHEIITVYLGKGAA